MKAKRTRNDWEQVASTNPLAIQMDSAKRVVGDTLDKHYRLAVLCGPPGMGKTTIVDQALKERGKTALRPSVNDYRELVHILAEGARKDMVVLFEEGDHLLRSERQANTLKKATDRLPEQRVAEMVKTIKIDGETLKETVQVNIGARVIIISNLDWRSPNADPRMRDHIEAIKSRSPPAFIGAASREQEWEYACHLAICRKLIRTDYDLWTVDKALEWFTRNLYRMADGSPRTLQEIARTIAIRPAELEMWGRDLELNRIVKPEAPDFEPPGGAMPRMMPKGAAAA